MALKHRVLADWKIPITDDRVKKMNTARWMMAHYQQLDSEKTMMRQLAKLCGTLLDDFEPDSSLSVESDKVRVLPLSMFVNPEMYKKIMDNHDTIDIPQDGESSFGIPDTIYEEQVRILESGGQLTDIDDVLEQVQPKVEEAKKRKIKYKLKNHPGSGDEDNG